MTMPMIWFPLIHRVRDWRRTLRQIRSVARDGGQAYRLARNAIAEKKALQRKWELIALIERVRALRPKTIVEIGTYRGGTLYCFAQVADPAATIISLDLPGMTGCDADPEAEIRRLKTYLRPGQSLRVLRKDSHAVATRDEVLGILGSRKVDFLFIDGDHTSEGVRTDFELYFPLVRHNGLIALHDIVYNREHPACEVDKFWGEVKKRHPFYELIDRDGFETWGGIGVVISD